MNISRRIIMKVLLYICGVVAVGVGIYEFTWLGRSSIVVIIIILSFIVAINSFAIARKIK
jgi:hypothetical protein